MLNPVRIYPLEFESVVVVGSRVVLIVEDTVVDTVVAGGRVGGGAKNDELQLSTLTLTSADILSINSVAWVVLDLINATEALKSLMKTMLGGVRSSLLKSTA